MLLLCFLAAAPFHAPVSNAQDAQWKVCKPDAASAPSKKKSAINLSLVLLEPDFVLGANFPDVKTFTTWMSQVMKICEDVLTKEKSPPRLLVQMKESDEKTPESNLLPISEEDTIARFLYCLEKLGCPELKKNFKGDFEPMFQKTDLKLKQHREQ